MKKCILTIVYVAILSQCCGQSQIRDENFAKFVEKFPTEKFPINTKKIKKMFNVDNEKSNITKDEAVKFLNRTEESMIYFLELYDYDEDIVKGYEKAECIPGIVCKYFVENFICLITIEGKINSDTTLMHLNIFDYNGKMVDQCIIGEQFTRENDWVGCVIEDGRHFTVFLYSTNFDNYIQKNGVLHLIDKEKPLSKVITENYEISIDGRIQKKDISEPILLKENILEYKSHNTNNDDPMK